MALNPLLDSHTAGVPGHPHHWECQPPCQLVCLAAKCTCTRHVCLLCWHTLLASNKKLVSLKRPVQYHQMRESSSRHAGMHDRRLSCRHHNRRKTGTRALAATRTNSPPPQSKPVLALARCHMYETVRLMSAVLCVKQPVHHCGPAFGWAIRKGVGPTTQHVATAGAKKKRCLNSKAA